MECFGTTDFDNNSRMITLSAIIIGGLHCIYKCFLSTVSVCRVSYAVLQMLFAPRAQNQNPCIPGLCVSSDLYVVYVSMHIK
jgi:hypothetical protein